ncbi:DUF397 domain-containing protein [Streptomyces sp. NPDC048496]|uniref:DUF397 domain-containing protein n=1 Tax=Streptomyces sp. NPDC048496 TaxID=3365558 RepID=UPI0037101207
MERVSRLDLTGADWRKSSYSNQEGGNCVEVADGFPGVVPVRDSKNVTGPALAFPVATWTAFISELKTNRRFRPGR